MLASVGTDETAPDRRPFGFARSSWIVLSSSALSVAISFVTGILLARTLGPLGRGQLMTVLLWPSSLGLAASLSLHAAVVFFGAAEPRTRRPLFANAAAIALVAGLVVACGGWLIVPRLVRLTDEQRTAFIVGLVLTPVGIWVESARALLQCAGRFGALGCARVAAPAITCVALVVLFSLQRISVRSAVLATWAGLLVEAAILAAFLRRDGVWAWRADLDLLRRQLRYSLRAHGGTLAQTANRRLDQLVLTVAVDARSAGLYAFATTLAELLTHGAGAAAVVLCPQLAAQRDPEVRRALAVRSVRGLAIFQVVGALVLVLLARPFTVHLWGPQFLDAMPTFSILLPGVVMLGVASTISASLAGSGRPQAGSAAELGALLVSAPLLVVLAHYHGIVGAAVGSTIGYGVNLLIAARQFRRAFGAGSLRALVPRAHHWLDLYVAFRARSTRS